MIRLHPLAKKDFGYMKKGRKFKVGVIGCGAIFRRHLEAVTLNGDKYELVAICDVDPKRVSLYRDELGVKGFTDYRRMLKELKGEINFVVITSPNAYHFEQAMAALRLGCDVLVEKPVDLISERATKIANEARRLKRKAYAVLQVRYNKALAILKDGLKRGVIGKVRSVSLTQRWQRPEEFFNSWRSDPQTAGRILYDVGIHYLDVVQWLFGLPEVKVSCTFNNKHTKVAFEDTVFAILRFPSGASGSLEVTIAAEPRNLECSLSVMGSEGYIKIGGKALDKIESAQFTSSLKEDFWEKIVKKHGNGADSASYGPLAGSAPNHPILYREIAMGRGIPVSEAINSIRFIEDIYKREI